MRYLFIIAALFSFAFNCISQIDEAKFEQKMLMKNETKDYSWAHRNLFIDGKYTALTELFIVPKVEYDYLKYDYAGDTEPDSVTFTDNGIVLTLASITLEPRVNLVSNKNSAWFIKSPLSFAFSFTTNGDMNNKRAGFFHINAPIMIGYCRGLNSSFQNTNNSGFAISAGYQFLLAPLVGGSTNYFTEVYDQNDLKPINEPYEQRKQFGMPIVQIDYYKLNRFKKIKGYSLAFCPYGNIYFKLAMNFAISKK